MKSSKDMSAKRPKKRLWLLILPAVIGFVAGCFLINRLVSPLTVVKIIELEDVQSAPPEPGRTFDKLRIGCYNIAHGRGSVGTSNWGGGNETDKQNRLQQIADLLKQQNLDIVVLNEADFDSLWSGHTDQAILIARQAGYRYLAEQRNIDIAIPFASLRFGNAILSRFPISDTIFLDFPHPSRFQELFIGGYKDGLVTDVTLPTGEKIQVAAVHLSLEGEGYRTGSVEMIINHQKQSGLPMIAMGDFNSTAQNCPGHHIGPNSENAIEALLKNPDWTTLPKDMPVKPEDYTFPAANPARTIDWIFTSTPLQLTEKQVLKTNLSDHLPITATIAKTSNSQPDDN